MKRATKAELKRLEAKLVRVPSGWSRADREFSRTVALLAFERMMTLEEAVADLSVRLDKALARQNGHKKSTARTSSAWQQFFAAGMRAGKTPQQIGAEWRDVKVGGESGK